MVLGSTETLTEMSTRNLPGGKRRTARKADNHIAICEPTVYRMWESRLLTNLWASTAYYKIRFTVTFFKIEQLWTNYIIKVVYGPQLGNSDA
jgi:hypothetical protein